MSYKGRDRKKAREFFFIKITIGEKIQLKILHLSYTFISKYKDNKISDSTSSVMLFLNSILNYVIIGFNYNTYVEWNRFHHRHKILENNKIPKKMYCC